MLRRWSSLGGRAYAVAAIVLLLLAGSAAAAAGLGASRHTRLITAARSGHAARANFASGTAGSAVAGAPARAAVPHGKVTHATAAQQLERLIAAGKQYRPRSTVQMGEVLGLSAPGTGEVLRVHSVWNTTSDEQADAVTLLFGRLGADLPSQQVASTVDVSKDGSTWIKPTVAGAKWTYERLGSPTPLGAGLLSDVLALAGRKGITRLSSKSGSKWRISYDASDLQLLAALRGQVPPISKLDARSRSLLSNEHLSIPDVQLTLDSHGRLTELTLGGVLTESRADATARHAPYPVKGENGAVELHIVYVYGGRFAITPPPTRDIINPRKPLR